LILFDLEHRKRVRKRPEEILKAQMLHWVTALSLICLGQSRLCAQAASDSGQKADTSQSWTATSEQRSLSGDSNPVRTVQSHTERDGRKVDRQEVERLGPDGRYEPYADTEREEVRIDANTVRTVQRSFARGPDGQKTLVQVTEEESRALSDGQQRLVRSTSSPDVNGRLRTVQRELQETRQSSPGVQVTKTTVMTSNIDGNLAPSVQIEERRTKKDNHSLEFHKSTLLPNGNGGWQVSEVREGVVTEGNDKSRTKDERWLQPRPDGTLMLVGRTISKETGNGSAEQRETVEEYSTNVAGGFGDGSLQLNRRVTTVRRVRADGQKTTQEQVEQTNPADPSEPLRLTQKTIDTMRLKPGGSSSEIRTIESLNANGDLGVVWVDTSNVQSAPAVQVDMTKGSMAPAVNVDTKTAKPK
jgi:sirohydrochlorin ferrochelatase